MITSFSFLITPRPFFYFPPHRPPPVRQIASEKKKKKKTKPLIPLAETKYSPLRAISNGTLKDTSSEEEEEEEEIDVCPVDCVTEFYTEEEFQKILEKAKERGALVVVDFYRTSCGSCKYIEQGFKKMCKGAGDDDADVIFLKHNVIDEYDEQSEVADRLRIKVVPLFHFYKDGVLLEAFPTRDKEKIIDAIRKYTSNK
ncbi:hypothetical protein LUZ62_075635 [Rhynchospora pubera]|uniref:Thioredoxin domain-containing protein n=1 Tax=Rhynchospora pubera TaxID=906938 RepID=A0AAV8D926_9POAL|nr:hypothetical protein LUZ62_075635 [Rhynchospora pubera]